MNPPARAFVVFASGEHAEIPLHVADQFSAWWHDEAGSDFFVTPPLPMDNGDEVVMRIRRDSVASRR